MCNTLKIQRGRQYLGRITYDEPSQTSGALKKELIWGTAKNCDVGFIAQSFCPAVALACRSAVKALRAGICLSSSAHVSCELVGLALKLLVLITLCISQLRLRRKAFLSSVRGQVQLAIFTRHTVALCCCRMQIVEDS